MEENDAATRRFHDGSCVPQSRATRPRPDAAVACCACTQYADQPGRAAEKPKKGAKRKPALDIPLGLQSPWQEVADDVNAPLGPHPIRWGSASDCQKRESRLQALFLCVGPLAPTTKALVSRRPRGPSSRKPNPGRHGGISLARQRGGFAASHPPDAARPRTRWTTWPALRPPQHPRLGLPENDAIPHTKQDLSYGPHSSDGFPVQPPPRLRSIARISPMPKLFHPNLVQAWHRSAAPSSRRLHHGQA